MKSIKNRIVKIIMLLALAILLTYIMYPREHKKYDFSTIILQQEKKALQGNQTAIFSVFGYYIITQHNYSRANDFFLDLSANGYKKEAMEIIEHIANLDEFKNNKSQLLHLNRAADENISLAVVMQNFIKREFNQ